jgi:hypothetical protein
VPKSFNNISRNFNFVIFRPRDMCIVVHMTCRISLFQDGGSLNNYITIFLAEGIWKVHIFRLLFVCFQTSVYMQNIIQIHPCLLKLSCKQESVTDGQPLLLYPSPLFRGIIMEIFEARILGGNLSFWLRNHRFWELCLVYAITLVNMDILPR